MSGINISHVTVNVLKFQTLYSLVIRAGINKMHVRIANREDPDQTALVCGVCLSLFASELVFEILEHQLYVYL